MGTIHFTDYRGVPATILLKKLVAQTPPPDGAKAMLTIWSACDVVWREKAKEARSDKPSPSYTVGEIMGQIKKYY